MRAHTDKRRRLPYVWAAGLGLIALSAASAGAGLLDSLKGVLSPGSESGKSPGNLTNSEISEGLLEALRVGAEKAVGKASAVGGFLDNPKIRIPLPKAIQSVARTLKTLGMGQQVDEFETAMNRGAERAATKALPIFVDAIKGLTFQDVQRIWNGDESAATQYLRDKTSEPLTAAFEPVVHAAAQEVGVTRSYQALTSNSLVQTAVSGSDLNLDRYVTGKALDGLFTLLADEEKQIRSNPAARTTDLLKKVFSR